MDPTCAPAQKTTTTCNRSIDYSVLTGWERKTLPIGQWREEVDEIGIRHAIEEMSFRVAFNKLMNARRVACISFELVAVVSVEEPKAMPLYCTSLCGFCALTEHLIVVSS
jgi:hypothetical protein